MTSLGGPKQNISKSRETELDLKDLNGPKKRDARSLIEKARTENAPRRQVSGAALEILHKIRDHSPELTPSDVKLLIKACRGHVEQDPKGRLVMSIGDKVCLLQPSLNVKVLAEFLTATGYLRQGVL